MSKKCNKVKWNKHSVFLDPNSDQMFVLKSLLNGADFLEDKYGIIPEVVDKRCIESVGMRLNLLIPVLLEIGFRSQLLTAGKIKDPLVYFPKTRFGDNITYISEKDHKDFCLLFNIMSENTSGFITFFDYFHQYCEAEASV